MFAALGVCAAAVAAVAAFGAWQAGRTTIAFHRADGAVPALRLTMFPAQLAFAAPSPPPACATRTVAAGDAATLTRADMPEHAVVRYEGDGIGAGFVHVQLGAPSKSIPLRPPGVVRGRIGEPAAFWLYGWRCADLRPIAGAEVLVMGGGEHGIELGRATTAEDGTFAIAGIDTAQDGLGLRVRAAGYALAHPWLERAADGSLAAADVALAAGAVRTGRIDAPDGFDCATLQVLARGLPGVQATPASDGRFTLAHLPANAEPRLLLLGLPPTLAHADARVAVNAETNIQLVAAASVRGVTRSVATGKPLADALVWIGDHDAVRTGSDGRFELLRVLPGAVAVQAEWQFVDARRRRHTWRAMQPLQLAGGQTIDDVELVLTDR